MLQELHQYQVERILERLINERIECPTQCGEHAQYFDLEVHLMAQVVHVTNAGLSDHLLKQSQFLQSRPLHFR